MPDCEQLTGVVRKLALYLRRNPEACDTTEGIAQWWFDGVQFQRQELAQALAILERVGLVESMRALDGHVLYRRSRADEEIEMDAKLDRLICSDTGSSTQ